MLNYPEKLKNINITSRLNGIAVDLEKNGFVLKGKKINENEASCQYNDKTIKTIALEELNRKQKEQIDYIERYSKEPLKENIKICNILFGLSALMVANSILVKVPLFGLGFAYFGGISIRDGIKLIILKRQIEKDKWFSDHEERVNKELDQENKLYKKLSKSSKTILTRDGKITLNNIDEFPKNDLILVRRNISRKLKKEEKVKTLSR